jgi:hypothetical protein
MVYGYVYANADEKGMERGRENPRGVSPARKKKSGGKVWTSVLVYSRYGIQLSLRGDCGVKYTLQREDGVV